jgi:hypothetical protein
MGAEKVVEEAITNDECCSCQDNCFFFKKKMRHSQPMSASPLIPLTANIQELCTSLNKCPMPTGLRVFHGRTGKQ